MTEATDHVCIEYIKAWKTTPAYSNIENDVSFE